jgi:hypothetical protein
MLHNMTQVCAVHYLPASVLPLSRDIYLTAGGAAVEFNLHLSSLKGATSVDHFLHISPVNQSSFEAVHRPPICKALGSLSSPPGAPPTANLSGDSGEQRLQSSTCRFTHARFP